MANNLIDCTDIGKCSWTFQEGEVSCHDGAVNCCSTAVFAEAGKSQFHDKELQKATKALNAVLDMIPEDKHGRKLSFLQTPMGPLLAWVWHGKQISKGDPQIECLSPPPHIKRALKLKGKL